MPFRSGKGAGQLNTVLARPTLRHCAAATAFYLLLTACAGDRVPWTPCDSTLSRSENAQVQRAEERGWIEAAQLWRRFAGKDASIGDASGIGQFLMAGGSVSEAIPYLKVVAHSDCQNDKGYHLLLVAEAYFEIQDIEGAREYAALTREFLRNDVTDRGESLVPAGVNASHLVRDGLERLDAKLDELAWERHRQSVSGSASE